MSVMTECQYRKLRDGSWGVLGPASVLKAGAVVTVWKRDGSAKTEKIIEVTSRPFDVDGVKCVYGRIERVEREPVRSGDSSRATVCAECGGALRGRGTQCRDSSGIAGVCCSRCAAMPSVERSFM